MPSPWRRYAAGHPTYLARHYWWAYLWPFGVWFFDRAPVVNAVLFGQYGKLMTETLRRYSARARGRTLQLSSVYGDLTPALAECAGHGGDFHVMDVAAIQLRATRRKLRQNGNAVHARNLVRMNAEALAYASDSFDTIVLYFLLHEMPSLARRRTLVEALRVLKPNGRIIIAEYGGRVRHLLQTLPFRWVLGAAEPFLPGFWDEDLSTLMRQAADVSGKQLIDHGETAIFGGFYRVAEFRCEQGGDPQTTSIRVEGRLRQPK